MSKIPLFYWDSCIWLSWLKNEQRSDPAEMAGLEEVAAKFDRKQVRIITSVLAMAEVLRSTLSQEAQRTWDSLLGRSNCEMEETSHIVWSKAHDIRDYYKAQSTPVPTVSDAVHLATAIIYQVDVFHTWDMKDRKISAGQRTRGLIPLSGNVAGYNLVICKPHGSQPSLF